MNEGIKGLLSVLAGGVLGVGTLAAIYTLSPPRPPYTQSPSSTTPSINRSDLGIVQPPRDRILCLEPDYQSRPTRGYETTSSIDINGDTSSDFYDVDAFVKEFEVCSPRADFNRDGFIDFYDVDDFVKAYESGCS